MPIRNVDEDNRAFFAAVGTAQADTLRTKQLVVTAAKCHHNKHPFFLPDWLIGLVADVEAPPLKLDDVSFLQALQTWIAEHLLLQLRVRESKEISQT